MTFHPLPEPIAEAFARQANACADLGSPLTASICALIAERGLPDGKTRRRIATWPEPTGADSAAVALRFTAALHRLVLDQAHAGLAAIYPPAETGKGALVTAIGDALASHDDFIAAYLDSPPQTNEVARSALLLPSLVRLQDAHGLPLRLMEMGASAGLNQNLDQFQYDYGNWQWGEPSSPLHIICQWRGNAAPPKDRALEIADRAACDIAPVPTANQSDHKRLQSYIWPDQTCRLERMRAALALAVNHPPQVDQAGAADWLEAKLAPLPDEHQTVLIHTMMWHYLPAAEKARAEAAIRRAGRDAGPNRPFAWLRFDIDGHQPGGGLYLTRWHGVSDDGITRCVGRGDYHGRWIEMFG